MKRLDVARVLTPEQGSAMVGETVAVHEPTPIEPGTIVHDADTGAPLLGYMRLEDPAPLRRALLSVDCSGGVQRQKNYRSRSRTFGYAPRRPVMGRESCTLTSITSEQPDVAQLLETYADQFSRHLKAISPEVVETNLATLGDVLPEWRLGEAKLWTSGVINDTAQLPYHRDGFNFPTWSAMPVVRRGTRGGHLHLPEWNIVVPCADSTVTFFEGFRWVHGVTPIQRVKAKEGYRISVVYYALKGMLNCREAAEEAAYGRRRRTEREADMAKRLAAGDREIPGRARQ
ncbi:oxidoreductase [Gordonia phage CloverMinnie]|nr:oxidoreductase [Gordonia phage CloverMinnie]UBF41605.1 oxidoreductase [Gordonia phage AnarQue]WAB09505.1 Tet-like J-binding protein [Gordonia phage Wooper]